MSWSASSSDARLLWGSEASVVVHPTKLAGLSIVELEPHVDERGSFTRTFDAEVFTHHGMNAQIAQCSTSFNRRAGTLRGMHYQIGPHAEGKLVRCGRGSIFDVAVDLRPDSPTHMQWVGFELDAAGARSVFIPEGCAHGFQTLEDESEVHYQMTTAHAPDQYRGVRWNDPAFGIRWPEPPAGERTMCERDRSFPDYAV
jgi:dTDP-4-dehydrorhamnose 3,5-epimerase